MPTEIIKDELARTFCACVQKSVEEYCQATFAKNPKVEQRDIIEYQSRMRVFGLEKFNDTCYIAHSNLYESPLEQEQKDTCGLIIVYVSDENAERLFKSLLRGREESDEELVTECTAELCKIIFTKL